MREKLGGIGMGRRKEWVRIELSKGVKRFG